MGQRTSQGSFQRSPQPPRGGKPWLSSPFESARAEPGRRSRADLAQTARTETPDEAPLRVRYADERDRAYLVRELAHGQWVSVPKQRMVPEPYPFSREERAVGGGLLRWSLYALVGALLGGIGGVLLGLPVALSAAIRLQGYARRVRRWRRERTGPDGALPLPPAASADRLRLRTALWQGLLAATLGLLVLALLLDRLP
jgi:hypothetical protein